MFTRAKEIRQLFRCARGDHVPAFTFKSSGLTLLGATHYRTFCKHCGCVYDAKVQPA